MQRSFHVAEAGEYFWLRIIVFITVLSEQFKTLRLKSDGWIFCCELFVSCHSSLMFAKYVDVWLFSEEICGVFYAKGSVQWLWKQGFFSGQLVVFHTVCSDVLTSSHAILDYEVFCFSVFVFLNWWINTIINVNINSV